MLHGGGGVGLGGDDGSGDMSFAVGGPIGRPSRTKGAKARSVDNLRKVMGERDHDKAVDAAWTKQIEKDAGEVKAAKENEAAVNARKQRGVEERRAITARNAEKPGQKREAVAKMKERDKDRQEKHDAQRKVDVGGINRRAEQRVWEGERLRAKARAAMAAKKAIKTGTVAGTNADYTVPAGGE